MKSIERTNSSWLLLTLCLGVGCQSPSSALDKKASAQPAAESIPVTNAAPVANAAPINEGRMGKSDLAQGQYALKNEESDPGIAKQAAIEMARQSGILGTSLPNGAMASASSGFSDGEMFGGLVGDEVAETKGGLGSASFGASGHGPGGGGTGWGSTGTGRYGTIGHGAGTGSGYGAGSGRAGMRRQGQYDAAYSNTESYTNYGVNDMTSTAEDKQSTFAIDVDTASYAIARRKINEGALPPPNAVRVEEFVNYFRYDYAGPDDGRPFAVHMDAAPSPYIKGRHILRVGVQAKKLANSERKASNLVFLVDVSGSMDSPDKLDLAKRALRILVDNLRDGDTVSLVTYAGDVRVVLEPTGLTRKSHIVSAIESLRSGGGTAMGSGVELAYQMAARNLREGAESRVIVLSDGDANIGNTSHEQILATIAGHVKEGVTLSTIGFGMGNYKDALMEQFANKGNGNYYYIDGISQARRVFQEQLGGTLEVVAKDVKIQVELDPEVVTRYRLIGYENRDVADRDFRNDKVDAGEIGAGHTVTALYELELAKNVTAPLGVVRIRAKEPRGTEAKEWVHGFAPERLYASFAQAPADFRFATAVMGAAEILRKSKYASDWKMGQVLDVAEAAGGGSIEERREFVALMRKVRPHLANATRTALAY